MDELQTYRNQIDEIDQQIINLLAQRFEVVKKVGKYKKERNMTALQPSRWQEVLESKKQLALKAGIGENFVINVWNEIHKYALELEK